MIALFAAAVLAVSPAQAVSELTPAQLGQASVYAGMCSTIGWQSSRERAVALAETCVAETGWTTRPPSRRLPAPVNAASGTDAVFRDRHGRPADGRPR